MLNQNEQKQYIFQEFSKYILARNTPPQLITKFSQTKDEINKLPFINNQNRFTVFLQHISDEDWQSFLFWSKQFVGIQLDYNFIKMKNQSLLKQISHINFINLQNLQLNNSQLISIQSLSWLICPDLRELYLYDNFFTSLKPLAKTVFNNLQRIDISYNKFLDSSLGYLCKIKTNNSLKCLYIQYIFEVQFKIGYQLKQYINQLFKLQTTNLSKQMGYLNIVQQKVRMKLKNKFNNSQQQLISFLKG